MTLKTSRVLLIHYFISYTHSFRCSPSLKSQILFLRYLRLISSGFGLSLSLLVFVFCIYLILTLSVWVSLLSVSLFLLKTTFLSRLCENKQKWMMEKDRKPYVIACLLLVYIWCKLHLSLKTTTSQPFFASIIFI